MENMQYIVAWAPQGWEWIIILVIALLIFGKRLPEVARSIGKSLTAFKKGIKEGEQAKDELEDDVRKIKDDITNETKKAGGTDNSHSDA
ncbi:MAG: twin-arginine translocase TatA/TatE family subunit [Phycisphaerae bacterium]|jgi:sec-independent protein translocase protein TatA